MQISLQSHSQTCADGRPKFMKEAGGQSDGGRSSVGLSCPSQDCVLGPCKEPLPPSSEVLMGGGEDPPLAT